MDSSLSPAPRGSQGGMEIASSGRPGEKLSHPHKGAMGKHERLQERVAGQTVGAVKSRAGNLAAGK